jgi:hypothetical protein
MKMLFFVAASITIVVAATVAYVYHRRPEIRSQISKVEIYSSGLDETIFIKKKVWGLTGDHQLIVVTKSPTEDFEPNERTEYVYRGLSPFFFIFGNDTLTLYVTSASTVPAEMSTKITIRQIVLTNPEMIRLMETYEEKGLRRL